MNSPSAETNRSFWLAQARGVARRINLAWWLETFSAPLIIVSLCGAAALLYLRNQHPGIASLPLAAGIAAGLSILALTCWLVSLRKFEKPERSLVRLEAAMGLHNRLSAAHAGVAPWPAPSSPATAGVQWHWPRLIVPPVAAIALLSAGLFVPVSSAGSSTSPPEQPQAWKQLDSSLEHLAKEDAVDESYLEETRKKLDELRSQKEEQWFSHSSLEATDSLKKEHRSEMERVEQDLDRAANALESLEKNAGSNQAEQQRQLNEFQQAFQGLQNGAMKPNPELLEQMKQLNPENFGKLTPEQLQQLRDNLKKNAEAMKNASGKGEGDPWEDELLAGEKGDDEGEPGNGRGKGEIDRGPGHAPGLLGDEKPGLETGDLTALDSRDLSRATPGDLLQLQDGEHEADTSGSSLSRGGGTDATGAGGDRVWRESLDPAEQRTLKRFFE